jgi:hypothetical protein
MSIILDLAREVNYNRSRGGNIVVERIRGVTDL